MKDGPFVENVDGRVLRQLCIDHGPDQLLDVGLSFGFAFGKLVQTNFVSLNPQWNINVVNQIIYNRELE